MLTEPFFCCCRTKGLNLKQVVPQQIQAPAQDQGLPRIAHNVPNLVPMPGPVAMDLAVLADRFRLQRTTQTALQSIEQKIAALCTVTIVLYAGQIGLVLTKRGPLPLLMMILAIDRGEERKDFKILAFLFSQCLFIVSFHSFYKSVG